jgi:hypothetical protein
VGLRRIRKSVSMSGGETMSHVKVRKFVKSFINLDFSKRFTDLLFRCYKMVSSQTIQSEY